MAVGQNLTEAYTDQGAKGQSPGLTQTENIRKLYVEGIVLRQIAHQFRLHWSVSYLAKGEDID